MCRYFLVPCDPSYPRVSAGWVAGNEDREKMDDAILGKLFEMPEQGPRFWGRRGGPRGGN